MDDLKYKHFFVVEDGKMIFEDKEMFKAKMMMLEGKRSYAIMEEVKQDTTPNQYAYYFGGIIRKECMNSNEFAGMTERQIHNYLISSVEGETHTVISYKGNPMMYMDVPRIEKFGKKKMVQYIEEIIAFLQTEHNIHPKPAEHYKYNKYYFNPKTYK